MQDSNAYESMLFSPVLSLGTSGNTVASEAYRMQQIFIYFVYCDFAVVVQSLSLLDSLQP